MICVDVLLRNTQPISLGLCDFDNLPAPDDVILIEVEGGAVNLRVVETSPHSPEGPLWVICIVESSGTIGR
jgi:hypothetical protein